jgi:pilus assembly protein CpaB
MKQKIIPIVSVLIGVLAFFLTHRFLESEAAKLDAEWEEYNKRTQQIEVVGAARDIPSGTTLSPEDIGKMKVSLRNVGDRAVRPEQVQLIFGKKIMFNISKKEPILWSDVEGAGLSGMGLSPMINKKMRAISLNIGGSQGVSGMIMPNDRVDILGTFVLPSKTVPGEMESVTLTVLQDVTVLATGQLLAKQQLLAQRTRRGASYSTITVEVTPKEAELLVFAEQSNGKLTLALRNPSDVYYEPRLPTVNFEHLETQIPILNLERQTKIRKNPAPPR